MPTTRPRHLVTESDGLRRALDLAARRWPGVTARSQLLTLLAQEGARSLERDASSALERRLAAILAGAGVGNGAYGADYLETLRGDWPA